MRFTGKVVIVTGAASGIGLATAKRLGSEGARIVIADLDQNKCDSAAAETKAAGAPEAIGLVCDVSHAEVVRKTVDATVSRFGGFDGIVNNAGLMVFAPIENQTPEDWWKVLNVDLMGAVYFTQEAFCRMRKGGAIVNVSSIHAVETEVLVSSYAAAKAALLSLTRSSSLEAKPKGIRVNAVLPGAIDTPMLWENPNVKKGLEHIERSDVGKPEDLAAVIAFLLSDDARFVQGASIPVDGGRLSRL
jgi:meso-butanediol dehydrogenase/(S,S)-butanediol dehydrogenase/diacetyl reductase